MMRSSAPAQLGFQMQQYYLYPPPLQAVGLTCVLLRAVQRRRVESLVLGALSSSPVHRALVLVLGDQHSGIVRLFEVV